MKPKTRIAPLLLLLAVALFVIACSGNETTTTTPAVTTTQAVASFPADHPYGDWYPADDPHLVWTGDWTMQHDPYYAKWADSPGASVIIKFQGTQMTVNARTDAGFGIARVSLDNNTPVMVDLYAAVGAFRSEVWWSGTLPLGDHVVVYEWTGAKNPASIGTTISFNSGDVVGTLQ